MEASIRRFNEILMLFNKVDVTDNNKLTYAVKRIIKRFNSAKEPLMEAMNENIRDFNVNHCQVDEKGTVIIIGEGNNARYTFSKENKIASDKNAATATKQFLDTQINIEPYFIDNVESAKEIALKVFDDFDLEELTGILFEVDPTASANETVKGPAPEHKPAVEAEKMGDAVLSTDKVEAQV